MGFCSVTLLSISFSHAEYIHVISTIPKVLTHSSINSLSSKSHLNLKYHLKEIWMRLQVLFILR